MYDRLNTSLSPSLFILYGYDVHVGDNMGTLELWRRLVSSLELSVQWSVSDILYLLCLCCLEDGWKCKSVLPRSLISLLLAAPYE